MKDKELAMVPLYAFEAVQARYERSQTRLFIAFIVSMVVNIGCIAKMVKRGF